MDAPRHDLIRMTSVLRAEDDGRTLTGYAAVFDEWTEIDSWEGRFKERIVRGAFRKTLRESGDRVKVLFNHGMDPQIGDKPLGKPRVMKEDDRGLYVEVPLDHTSYNADLIASLRSGALDGMSFRMNVLTDQWAELDGPMPERTIKEIRLFEFGPVTFPAYAATQVGIRAHAPKAFAMYGAATGQPIVPRSAVPADPDADDANEAEGEQVADEAPPSEDVTYEVTDGPDDESTRSTDTADPAAVDTEEEPPARALTLAAIRRGAELTRDRMQLVLRNEEKYG